VVDQCGELQGHVTVQDLLESVRGELTMENSEDSWAEQREDGS